MDDNHWVGITRTGTVNFDRYGVCTVQRRQMYIWYNSMYTVRKHSSSYLVAFERELLYAKDHALFSRPYYNGRAVGTVLRLPSSVCDVMYIVAKRCILVLEQKLL